MWQDRRTGREAEKSPAFPPAHQSAAILHTTAAAPPHTVYKTFALAVAVRAEMQLNDCPLCPFADNSVKKSSLLSPKCNRNKPEN